MSNYVIRNTELDDDNNICFVCFEQGNVIRACKCKGTNNGVHRKCLEKWILESENNYCLICKHEYEYELIYKPSLSRCLKNNCYNYECKNVKFTENEDVLIIILLSFILPFVVLFIVSMIFGNNYLGLLTWITFIGQIIFLLCLKKFDRTLNFKITAKYLQIINSIIMYSYFVLMIIINGHTCYMECFYNSTSCNNNCNYYSTYLKNKNNYLNGIIHQSIILSTVIILLLITKINDLLYFKSIKEIN